MFDALLHARPLRPRALADLRFFGVEGGLVPSDDAALWALELAARTSEATYDRVKLWMSRAKKLPVKAEYYAASGKLLRSATFEDVKTFRGFERPAHIVMRNELVTQRFSEM